MIERKSAPDLRACAMHIAGDGRCPAAIEEKHSE